MEETYGQKNKTEKRTNLVSWKCDGKRAVLNQKIHKPPFLAETAQMQSPTIPANSSRKP